MSLARPASRRQPHGRALHATFPLYDNASYYDDASMVVNEIKHLIGVNCVICGGPCFLPDCQGVYCQTLWSKWI